jgi:protoporphyrinogen/coproporphyrinogen III oxidase
VLESPPVVVVGGGIAGLTAAHVLATRGQPFLLLEASDHWGGVVRTVQEDGFLFETGPDAMLTTKPDGIALVRALGLADRVVPTNPHLRTVYVVRRGALHPMPEGMILGVPTRWGPVWTSRLFSWAGKLRMAREPFVRRRTGTGDESIADFVRRRLGREAWERLGDALLGGIHAGDTERLSIRATFPRLVEMEDAHGSLVRGFQAAPKAPADSSAFVSLAGGFSELVDALVARIPAHSRQTSAPVTAIEVLPDGWSVSVGRDRTLSARAVVIALPAPSAVGVLRSTEPALADDLAPIRFVSTAIVLLSFAREQVAHPLDGYGLLVPRSEGLRVTAAGFFSTKFPGRAPDGFVSLRVFLGGAHDARVTDADDETLVGTAVRELAPLLGLRGQPVYRRVCRWPRSTPQMELGHRERVAAVEEKLGRLPGLFLTGSGLRGTGLPDTIGDATAAANAAADFVARETSATA